MSEAVREAIDVAALVEVLWAPRAKTRGPKPAHAREDVLAAAIGIADREGLSAVSMQRVAEEMGFTKMAVYRYLPGRPELVAAMTDRALGPPPAIPAGADWRRGLEAWALAAYAMFQSHPWGLEATTGARVIGPNEAAWTEAGLACLRETPLGGAERLDVLAVITGHLRSMAQQAAGTGSGASRGGVHEAVLAAGLVGREAQFPEFARAVAETALSGGADNGLGFGLACIFDGVAARLAATGRVDATPA